MPIVSSTDIPYRGFPEGRTSPQAPNAYQNIPTDTSMFGALEGKAQEQFGAGLEKLGEGVFNVGLARKRQFTQAEADRLGMELDDAIEEAKRGPRDGGIDPETGRKLKPGFLDRQGQDAVQAGVPNVKAIVDRVAAGAADESVRARFLHQSRDQVRSATAAFDTWYGAQVEKHNTDVQHAVGVRAGLKAANNSDADDGIEGALNEGRLAAARGPNPETQQIINDDRAVGSAIGAQLAKGNFPRAQQIFDKYGNLLTENSRNQYGGQLQARGRRDKIRAGAAEALGEPLPSGGVGGVIGTGRGGPTNPGNLKNPDGSFRTFATPQEGVAAIGDWFTRAQSAHGLKTVEQLINHPEFGYAPDTDPGNKGKDLAGKAAAALGVDKNAPVDMSDPAIREKMVQYILTQEGAKQGGTISAADVAAGKGPWAQPAPGSGLVVPELGIGQRAGETQVATGPAVTATDAGNAPIPAGGPSAPAVLPPVEVGAPAPTAPTAAKPAGPKPMISLEDALANAAKIADRENYTDQERDEIFAQTRSRHGLMRAKVEQQRKQLIDEVTNGEALLKDGRPFTINEPKIRSLMPPIEADQVIERLQAAEDFGAANYAIDRLSPGEIVQWRDSISKEVKRNPATAARRLQYLKQFDAAKTAREAALNGKEADPAAYLVGRDQKHPPEPGGPPSIAALYEAAATGDAAAVQAYASVTLREQARLGVLPENQRILTKNQAAAAAQRIAKTDPGTEDVGVVLEQMSKRYGGHWEKAFGEMVKAGLPREAKMIGPMTEPGQLVARQDMPRVLALIAEKGGEERFKEAVPKEARKTIDDGLDGYMNNFRLSNPDPDLTADVKSSIQQLAYYYAYRGDTAATALKKASNAFIDAKYDFTGKLRVPKGRAGIIEAATDAVQHHLRVEDLAENIPGAPGVTPEKNREIMLDGMKGGYWVTNPNDNGALLYLRTRDGRVTQARLKPEPGQSVGAPVEVKWSDVSRLAQFQPPFLRAPPTGVHPEAYLPPQGAAPPTPDRGFAPLGWRGLMLGGPPA